MKTSINELGQPIGYSVVNYITPPVPNFTKLEGSCVLVEPISPAHLSMLYKAYCEVLLKAIEHNSLLTPNHLNCLIQTLTHADASNNATTVILKAIECGVKFGPKERLNLAEVSKVVNAKKNVEKIRKALHERES